MGCKSCQAKNILNSNKSIKETVKEINKTHSKSIDHINQLPKICIVIPTLSKTGLVNQLVEILLSQSQHFEELLVIDNAKQNLKTNNDKYIIFEPKERMSISESKDFGIDYFFNKYSEVNHILFLNDNVLLEKGQLLKIRFAIFRNIDKSLLTYQGKGNCQVISRNYISDKSNSLNDVVSLKTKINSYNNKIVEYNNSMNSNKMKPGIYTSGSIEYNKDHGKWRKKMYRALHKDYNVIIPDSIPCPFDKEDEEYPNWIRQKYIMPDMHDVATSRYFIVLLDPAVFMGAGTVSELSLACWLGKEMIYVLDGITKEEMPGWAIGCLADATEVCSIEEAIELYKELAKERKKKEGKRCE